jgi:hypothetical protein
MIKGIIIVKILTNCQYTQVASNYFRLFVYQMYVTDTSWNKKESN